MQVGRRAFWLVVLAFTVGCGGGSSVAGRDSGQPVEDSSSIGGDTAIGGEGSDTSSKDGGVGGADTPILEAAAERPDAPVTLPDAPAGQLPRPMIWQLERNSPLDNKAAVGGNGDGDIWVVGSRGEASHSTGDGNWVHRDIRGPTLTGIWSGAVNDIYVSGYINAVYHWDGSGTWDRQTINSGAVLTGIWASGPNDLWAVGSGIFRSKGDRLWKYETIPAAESEIAGVWGSGPNDVYVVDGLANVLHSTGDGVWTKQMAGPRKGPGMAIWGSSPTDIYVLSAGAVLHSTGDGKWTGQELVGLNAEGLFCLWGSGPADLYIGGQTGSVFRSTGDGRWYRERLLPMNDPRDIVVAAVGGTSNNVYLVTEIGTYHGRPAP